jgi:hypothetical protein
MPPTSVGGAQTRTRPSSTATKLAVASPIGSDMDSAHKGGGIYIGLGSNVTAEDCLIRQNIAYAFW